MCRVFYVTTLQILVVELIQINVELVKNFANNVNDLTSFLNNTKRRYQPKIKPLLSHYPFRKHLLFLLCLS